MEDELRKTNKELLQTLRIGQKKAWDILNQDKKKESKGQPATCSPRPRYTCSTPTTAPYLTLLDKAGNTIPLEETLTSLDNTSVNSSTYGRPHKTPRRTNRPLLNYSDSSGPHSPLCTENHRDKLTKKLNSSYSQLADDLRRLAPYCGSDVMGGIADNSSSLSIKPESYYDEMRRFRLANSAECSVKLPHEKTVIAELEETLNSQEESKSTLEKSHQCIQTYTVGHGYRADDDHSCDQCPLCVGADDTKLRGLIRVNIPQSDEVKYTSKLNFNPDSLDSLGLSKHCSVGWKQSRNQYKVPSIPSFGYKAALTD